VSFSYDSITTAMWVCPHCTTTPTHIAERARRVVEVFNEWLVTDFEPTLTADKGEALRRIVAAEFGGGSSRST
jgi:hypothetical protein